MVVLQEQTQPALGEQRQAAGAAAGGGVTGPAAAIGARSSMLATSLPCYPGGVAPGRRCHCRDPLLGPGHPLQALPPRC